MVRSACASRCRQNSFLARLVGGLGGFALLLLVGFLTLLPDSAVASTNPSYDAAMSDCLARAASLTYTPGVNQFDHCGTWDQQPQTIWLWLKPSTRPAYPYTDWSFTGPVPPSNPCTSLPAVSIYLDGKVTNGFTFSQPATDPSTGARVQCAMTASVNGAPVWNQWSNKWQTFATLTPTGSPADTTGVKDGSGSPVPDVQNPGTYSNQSSAPSVCEAGSCYNAASDKYSASSNGSLSFIGGDVARSAAGGCAGGGAVLCAGSPTAPLPTPAQVRDPPTDMVQSDKYTQADPTTGALLPVVVNIYRGTVSSGTPTSGQQAGDSGPASASSSPSTPSSYSGGGDCNTPPACSGDAAVCGIARQQWLERCDANKRLDQVHTDLSGDGSQSSAINTLHSSADVFTDGTTTGDPVADAANQGNYDASGLGFSTQCPLTDLDVPIWNGGQFVVPLSKACVVGEWIQAIVLAFAAFAAAKITAKGMS